MPSKSHTKPSRNRPASKQMDLFAEANRSNSFSIIPGEDFDDESSSVDGTLRYFYVRYKSDVDISANEIHKCQHKINALVTHIDRQKEAYCKNFEIRIGSAVSNFSILPTKSPRDLLTRANITVDGRHKDWGKINSDLKLAFYKTASDSLKGIFLRQRKRTA